MPLTLSTTPQGWVLRTPPDEGVDGVIELGESTTLTSETVPALLRSLRAWADENNLQLHPAEWVSVRWAPWLETQFWGRFQLLSVEAIDNEGVLGQFSCTCGATHEIGTLYCAACTRFLLCGNCRVAGANLYGTQCARCAPICREADCTNRVDVGDGRPRCATCDPRGRCSHCDQVVPSSELAAHTQPENAEDAGRNRMLCGSCQTGHICGVCTSFFPARSQTITLEGTATVCCPRCAARIYAEQRADLERWDAEEMPASGSLVIPDTDERPVRTISLELEFDGNRNATAQALYGAGLIQGPEISRYSEQGRQEGRFPCILKSDASVSGGELVAYLIDLNNENHAAALLRMTEVMKGCRDTNLAEFSYRAGGHVHVDLHGMSFHDLWVLYTLFRYLELPLYYMAGSGSEFGHRSLSGSGYANPSSFGPFGNVAQFWQQMQSAGRYGLHFDNFSYALNNCRCGHTRIGRPESCTCDLGKATAEWRLWNAEITPRILHGWFALMQAMTAWATDKEGSFNEDDFPYLPWSQRRFNRLNNSEVTGIRDRLTWIFESLPLTSDERDSVLYVIKQSELSALGDEFIDGLLNVAPIAQIEPKKKAKATARTQTFALEPVEVAVGAFDAGYPDYDDDEYYDEEDDF